MIDIKHTITSIMQTNCYIITDIETGFIAIIDAGAYSPELKRIVEENKDNIKYVLLTHGHFDHIEYAYQIKCLTNAEVVISSEDEKLLSNNELNLSIIYPEVEIQKMSADIKLNDNDSIMLGNTKIKFILTPGHTSGSGCYIIDDNIFTGDTLMKLSIGRLDFPTGSKTDMIKSLVKLSKINGEYKIFPGHGSFTSLDYEKRYNQYIKYVLEEQQ